MYATHRHDLFFITVKNQDNVQKGIQVTGRTRKCLKSMKGEITQKVLKRELSFLYATHCQDLFYITVKYHQNITTGFQVIERTRNAYGRTDVRTDRRTDARLIAISPEPFGRGIKR